MTANANISSSFRFSLYKRLLSYRWVAAITLVWILLSLYLHLDVTSSSMQMNSTAWAQTLQMHLHERPFYVRPLQSYATVGLHALTGMTEWYAFYAIQYALAVVTVLLLFRWLIQLGFDRIWAHLGLVAFLLSLPILGAFLEPIHTWDDFWLYLFLTALCLALLRRRWMLVAIFYFLACLAREAALFFFPVLVLAAWHDRKEVNPLALLVSLMAPVLAYLFYLSRFHDAYGPGPWRMLHHNFGDSRTRADSVVSLINAFGWMLPAAIFGAIRLLRRPRSPQERYLLFGLLIYWPINTAVSCSLAMVRETRLLFPPFIFVVPLALIAVRELWTSWGGFFRSWRRVWLALFVLAMGAAGVGAAYALNPTFAYGASSVMRRDYSGLSVGLGSAFVLLWFLARRRSATYRNSGEPGTPIGNSVP